MHINHLNLNTEIYKNISFYCGTGVNGNMSSFSNKNNKQKMYGACVNELKEPGFINSIA